MSGYEFNWSFIVGMVAGIGLMVAVILGWFGIEHMVNTRRLRRRNQR